MCQNNYCNLQALESKVDSLESEIHQYSNYPTPHDFEMKIKEIENRISSIVTDFNEKFKTMSHRIHPLETSTNHTVTMDNIERLDKRIDHTNKATTKNRQDMFENLNSRLEAIEKHIRENT